MKLQFLVWNNASVASNDLAGVLELDEGELIDLVMEGLRCSGVSANHVELRSIDVGGISNKEELPVLKINGA